MSKYYLWNMAKNETGKYDSITTGSLEFVEGTRNNGAPSEQSTTVLSPNGEMIFRHSRAYGSPYTGSYIAIHQSQSAIAGGFHFGAGKDSDSVIWSSLFDYDTPSSVNTSFPLDATWLSNTELAIYWSLGARLSGSHSLSGSGFPSGDVYGHDGSNGSGLLVILSGSGSDWEVSYWATGSTNTYLSSLSEGDVRFPARGDYIVPNHRYTNTETDQLVILPKGRQYDTDSNRENFASVFKKTSGSWAPYSTFTFDNQPDRQISRIVHEANFLGENQDHIAFHYSDNANDRFAIFSPVDPGDSSRPIKKHTRVGDTSRVPFEHFAWDPYANKFIGQLNQYLYTFQSSSTLYGDLTNDSSTSTNWSIYRSDVLEHKISLGYNSGDGPELTDIDPDSNQLQFKFASGYTGVVWTNQNATGYMRFIESGSYGWLGSPTNWDQYNWSPNYFDLEGSDSTSWEGGAAPFAAIAADGRHSVRLTSLESTGRTWHWNTEKGGDGNKLFTIEGQDTQYNYSTGRNIIIDLNTYGTTPEEWAPLSSNKTDGATTYELSSSVASGLSFTDTYMSYDASASLNSLYTGLGGKFSPDGTKIAVAQYWGDQATGVTSGDRNAGVEIYTSGASGWTYNSFLEHPTNNALLQQVEWASDSEVWATTIDNVAPYKWTSGSGGWSTASYVADTSNLTEGESTGVGLRVYWNRIKFNPSKTAVVLWDGDDETVSGFSRAWGVLVSSSAGWSGYAYNSEGYENFEWAGVDPDGRLKLVGAHKEDASLNLGLIDPNTGQDTGGGLYKALSVNSMRPQQNNNYQGVGQFMYYHSGSDSLLYSSNDGSSSNVRPIIIEAKMNPNGLYKYTPTYSVSGTYAAAWIGYSSPREGIYGTHTNWNDSHKADVALPISSSVGLGRFDDADAQYTYRDVPTSYFASFADPNNSDRVFLASKYSTYTDPMRLKVLERGSEGWKMTTVYELSSGSTSTSADRYQLAKQFDLSSNGELVVPATGSNSGFAIASLSLAVEGGGEISPTSSGCSGTIGSAGGTVSCTGAEVTVPSSALSSDTEITLDLTAHSSDPVVNGVANATGPGVIAYSPVVEITPHGTQFSSAVTVTFDLSGSVAGTCPADLQVYKSNSDTGVWYELPSNLWSCSGGTITINTTSFSRFQAIGGNDMARTKLNNVQIAKLIEANKVLGGAIDITGSADTKSSVAADDVFLIQAASGISQKIAASAMQDFFSSVDVTETSGSGAHRIVFIDAGSGDAAGATLEVDNDSLTFDPSTNVLTVATASVVGLDADTADIDGGNIDGTVIGASSQAAGSFTSLSASSGIQGGSSLTIAGAADLNSTLNVEGDSVFQASASIQGDLDVDGTLDVTGAVYAKSTLRADGAADLNSTLDVQGASTFQSTVSASSDISGGGQLIIAGAADLNSSLNVEGAAVFQSSAQIDGAADLNSTLDVQGDANFQASASIAGDLDVDGTLDVTGAVYAKSTLRADGAADLNSTLDVQGASTFQSTVSASSDISGGGQLIIAGASDLNGSLNVEGAAVFQSSAQIDGAADLNSTLDVQGNATFQASASIQGDLDVDGTLEVTGASHLKSTLRADGAVDFNSTMDVQGSSVFQSTIQVGGAADLNSTLDVQGDAVFQSSASIQGDLDVDGTLDVTGAVYAKSTLRADGAVDFNSTLNVQDDATFQADISAVSGTFSGDVTITGDLTINGTTTTVNTEEVTIADHNIVLDSNNSLSDVVNGAGITIEGGTGDDLTFQWNTSDSDMELKKGSSFAKLHIGDLEAADINILSASMDHLTVDGASDLNGALDVQGAANLQAGLTVAGAIDANSSADFQGAVNLQSTLDVAGNAAFAASASVAGDMDIDGTLEVTGASHLKSTLRADGVVDFRSSMDVDGAATFQSTVSASSDISGGGQLIIAGASDLNGSLNVEGASVFQSSAQIDGAADLNSTLDVQGNATFQASASIQGDLDVDGTLEVTGASHLKSTLRADGVVDFRSSMDVDGAATFQSSVSASSDISGGGALTIAGASDLNGALSVAGQADFDGALNVTGAALLKSSVEIDGALQLDGIASASAALSDEFYFQGPSNEVRKESLADMLDLAKGDGIQISSGVISIDFVEDIATSASQGSILSSDLVTASLSQEPLADSVQVYLNGMLQVASGSAGDIFDYEYLGSAGARRIELAVALDSDDVIQIKYIKK